MKEKSITDVINDSTPTDPLTGEEKLLATQGSASKEKHTTPNQLKAFMGLETYKRVPRLLVYYGYPSAFGGTYVNSEVIDYIASNYDIYIVGDQYESPSHPDYANTQAILSGLKARGVTLYGYVAIGSANTISNITTKISDWVNLNVDGIFLDEFGFDYGSDRARQIEIVNLVKAQNLPYCANAWVWEEVSLDDIANAPQEPEWGAGGWKHDRFVANNPNNLVLPRTSEDAYMMENWGISEQGVEPQWGFLERADLTLSRNPDNMKIWGLGVIGEQPAGTIDLTKTEPFTTYEEIDDYITLTGDIFSLDAVGTGGFSFGSGGGTQVLTTKRKTLPIRLEDPLNKDYSYSASTATATKTISSATITTVCKPDKKNVSVTKQVDLLNPPQETVGKVKTRYIPDVSYSFKVEDIGYTLVFTNTGGCVVSRGSEIDPNTFSCYCVAGTTGDVSFEPAEFTNVDSELKIKAKDARVEITPSIENNKLRVSGQTKP